MTFRNMTDAVVALRREGWAVSARSIRPWFGVTTYQVEATRGNCRHSMEARSESMVLAMAIDVLAREGARPVPA